MPVENEEAPRGRILYCGYTGESRNLLRCPVSRRVGQRAIARFPRFRRLRLEPKWTETEPAVTNGNVA
eukprot:9915226-Heterocapsa_arctica.AAC.1